MAKSNTTRKALVIEGNSNTALATIEEAERQAIEGMQKRIQAPAGSGISIRDKQFKFPDGRIVDELEVVILDFVSRNLYYEGRFDPKNPAPPTCFAVGRELKAMVPSKNSPEVQNSDCDSCSNNQFGSNGTAKACKNTRYLAVIEASSDPKDAQIYTISVPPKSLKAFDGYLNTLTSVLKRASFGVVTKIGFHPEAEHEQLVFSPVGPNPHVAACVARTGEAQMVLNVEPDTSRRVAAEPARATKRARR